MTTSGDGSRGDAWRQELAPDGIQVAIVEPGPIAAPIWSKAAQSLDGLPASARYRERVDRLAEQTAKSSPGAASAVDLIVDAVTATRPRTRYPGGMTVRPVSTVRRLLPDRLFDLIARRITK